MKLDHLTITAPSLAVGVAWAESMLGVTIPFGTRHLEMGTHNHRLRIGEDVYMEIIAVDPQAPAAGRPRWFGLDDEAGVQSAWRLGRRLTHWVVSPSDAEDHAFRDRFSAPTQVGPADFHVVSDAAGVAIAWPSLIVRRGLPSPVSRMPRSGVELLHFKFEHPEPEPIARLLEALAIGGQPEVLYGPEPRYEAVFKTPLGVVSLR